MELNTWAKLGKELHDFDAQRTRYSIYLQFKHTTMHCVCSAYRCTFNILFHWCWIVHWDIDNVARL